MAGVACSSCSGLLLPPNLAGVSRWSPPSSSVRLRSRRRRRTIARVASPDSAEPQKVSARGRSPPRFLSLVPCSVQLLSNKDTNRRVALVSTIGAVALFASQRLDLGQASLKDLAANAVPYKEALSNGRPTVVEFYADWCEVCRELAPDIYNVEQQYKGRVNFVMLNVDNTKWEQELDESGVEGIPHFAFLDKEGNEGAMSLGDFPNNIFLRTWLLLLLVIPTLTHLMHEWSVSSQVQKIVEFIKSLIPEVMASKLLDVASSSSYNVKT